MAKYSLSVCYCIKQDVFVISIVQNEIVNLPGLVSNFRSWAQALGVQRCLTLLGFPGQFYWRGKYRPD